MFHDLYNLQFLKCFVFFLLFLYRMLSHWKLWRRDYVISPCQMFFELLEILGFLEISSDWLTEISLNKEWSEENLMSSMSLDSMISKVLKWSPNSLDPMFWSFQKIDWQTAFIKLLSKEFNGCSWKLSIKILLSSLLKSLHNNSRTIEENVKLLCK